MNEEQSAAYVTSQAACAIAQVEAMKAANLKRVLELQCGELEEGLPYDEAAFSAVQDDYCISHNAVISFFQGV